MVGMQVPLPQTPFKATQKFVTANKNKQEKFSAQFLASTHFQLKVNKLLLDSTGTTSIWNYINMHLFVISSIFF